MGKKMFLCLNCGNMTAFVGKALAYSHFTITSEGVVTTCFLREEPTVANAQATLDNGALLVECPHCKEETFIFDTK